MSVRQKKRCSWCLGSVLYEDYHDNEWGVPVYDDRLLFEFLILESAQAGLSWITILKRRGNYQKAYDNFDVDKVAAYEQEKVDELLQNEGIIRNKLKVKSSIENAKIFIQIQKEFGSFAKYIWRFVNEKPIINHFERQEDVPAKTALSEKISKDLKKRGMRFVGPTIIYAYMQAVGLVNDHTTGCFLHPNNQE